MKFLRVTDSSRVHVNIQVCHYEKFGMRGRFSSFVCSRRRDKQEEFTVFSS